MAKGPALAFTDFAVTLNGVELLKPINLELEAGGWHGIVGPNGGGKSTLLKSIAGLNPHSGQILIKWPSAEQNVGYMPQLAPFDTSLPISVLDFLRLSSQRQPVWMAFKQKRKLQNMVEKVGIQALLNKRLGTLSMGERQRVLLTCALLQKPSLLLLDEPLAGMDKAGQTQVLALLNEYHQKGGTLLMIEHNWQVLSEHADRVIFIDGGLCEEKGKAFSLSHQVPAVDSLHVVRSA